MRESGDRVLNHHEQVLHRLKRKGFDPIPDRFILTGQSDKAVEFSFEARREELHTIGTRQRLGSDEDTYFVSKGISIFDEIPQSDVPVGHRFQFRDLALGMAHLFAEVTLGKALHAAQSFQGTNEFTFAQTFLEFRCKRGILSSTSDHLRDIRIAILRQFHGIL